MTERDDDLDVDVHAVGFSSREYLEDAAASAAAFAFAKQLERTIATLDTSRYSAVEVLTPRISIGAAQVGGQPTIRLVEEGEPFAEELIEQGVIPPHRIERYDADEIETMRTYAHAALDRDELGPLERFVDERLDVPDDDVTDVAKKIARSIREHADVDEKCGRCGRIQRVDELPEYAADETGFERLCYWCQLEEIPEEWGDG